MADKEKIRLDVVTPSGVVFSESVDFFSLQGEAGSLGILPGHVPLFTMVDIGVLEYEKNGDRDFITSMGGFLEVHENQATLLTEGAERATDIDELRAKAAAERAEADLKAQAGEAAAAKADTLAALRRASIRLHTLDLIKRRRKKHHS